MYDAHRSCTIPMIWFAKTSNEKIANTECANDKLPKRRKGQTEDVWIGSRNDVTLPMRWRESHQMMWTPKSCGLSGSTRTALARSAQKPEISCSQTPGRTGSGAKIGQGDRGSVVHHGRETVCKRGNPTRAERDVTSVSQSPERGDWWSVRARLQVQGLSSHHSAMDPHRSGSVEVLHVCLCLPNTRHYACRCVLE